MPVVPPAMAAEFYLPDCLVRANPIFCCVSSIAAIASSPTTRSRLATASPARRRLCKGLLEIRGLGIVRLPYSAAVPLVLEVELALPDRLPQSRMGAFGCPVVMIDPSQASAVKRLDMALDCALGHVVQHTGAFTPW